MKFVLELIVLSNWLTVTMLQRRLAKDHQQFDNTLDFSHRILYFQAKKQAN